MLDFIFDLIFTNGFMQFLGAFLWGVASVVLSPCGVAMIPLVVGYIANSDNPKFWDALKISCAFCSGLIINLILIAFVISGVGYLLGGYEKFLTLVTAGVFILTGLHLLGIIRLKTFFKNSEATGNESQNLRGAILLGIMSGLATGSCNIAYVSPVLSIAFSMAGENNFLSAIFLVLAYSLGYSFVIILSGIFANASSKFLQASQNNIAFKIFNIICGIFLIVCGGYLIHEFFILKFLHT